MFSNKGRLTTVNYARHFLVLGCFSIALVFVDAFPSLLVYDRFISLVGWCGGLHALAIVMSLRSKAPALRCVLFIVGAVGLAIASPLAVTWFLEPLGHGIDAAVAALFLGLALASALGSVCYWLLVRHLWVGTLPLSNLLLTVGLCVAGVITGCFAIGLARISSNVVLPMFWWFAFSASLALGDRNVRE